MTRDHQLTFCKQCHNRKMDAQLGLVCSLTGKHASFETECPDFSHDETVKIEYVPEEPEEQAELRDTLSSDIIEKLRLEQNLSLAVIAGLATGIVGAILWGVITVASGYQIGYMALAIGAGVGFAMKYAGKGIDDIFGLLGGAIAVLSCVLGNFLSVMGFIAEEEGLQLLEMLLVFDYSYFIPLMTETFGLMDIVFYGIAGYEGYKFAFRTITADDINRE